MSGPVFAADERDGTSTIGVTADEDGGIAISQEVDGEHTTVELSKRGAEWLEITIKAARYAAARASTGKVARLRGVKA